MAKIYKNYIYFLQRIQVQKNIFVCIKCILTDKCHKGFFNAIVSSVKQNNNRKRIRKRWKKKKGKLNDIVSKKVQL